MLMQNSVYSGSTENTQNSVWILGKKKKKKRYIISLDAKPLEKTF